MRRCLANIAIVACVATAAQAQTGELLQYQQEIGGGIGLSSYIGDAGGGFLSHPGLMGTLIWRYNINQRMVVKCDLGMGHISGTTRGEYIPSDPLSETPEGGTPAPEMRFGRNVIDLGAQFEFNFLGYGRGAAYKGLSPWTPYVLAGAGVCIATGGGGPAHGGLCIPLGVGFRYKARPRLNIGLEWSVRFTTSDGLDDNGQRPRLHDPYGISSGMFKNKDCYMLTYVFITYDISPKYRKCNN